MCALRREVGTALFIKVEYITKAHHLMQQPLITLATAGLLLCTVFFVWSSVQYLGDHDWTFPQRRPPKELLHSNEELLAKNQQLEQALEAARASVEHAPAVTITAATEPTAIAVSDATDPLTPPVIVSDGFAYVFYATSDPYACSALVNIHRLQHVLNVTIPIHVLASSDVQGTYIAAFRAVNVTVHIEQAPQLKESAGGYYADCLLKLLAFKMHLIDPSLRRVLAFDSDQLILQNPDHLFMGLPDVDLAAPRAYWLAKDFLASTFLMINLSDRLWHVVERALDSVGFNKFDMDLINDLLGDTVMMLSGEYVTLNSHWEDWNLPTWYHPVSELNMTTVTIINQLAKAGPGNKKRQEEASLGEVDASTGKDDLAGLLAAAQPVPAIEVHDLTMIPPVQSVRPVVVAPVDPPGSESAWQGTPSPRFPANHPITLELYRLQEAAAVIHFTAQGKPWTKSPSEVTTARLDAHPILAEQFAVWRETAMEVCPGGVPGAVSSSGG